MFMFYMRNFFILIYSFFFCLRYLPLAQALKIPIYIRPSVRVRNMRRGAIVINSEVRHGMIVIGFPGTEGRSNHHTMISVHRRGRIVFGDGVTIAKGTKIVVADTGILTFGNHFFCNSDCFFCCTSNITIGDDNMYGWEVQMNTTNGHHVYKGEVERPMTGDIVIGRHVWIGSWANIAKGTRIADDSLVSQCSVVSGSHPRPHTLIAGNPASDISQEYRWRG